DQMAVVYHGNYFSWFEVGRTNYLRGAGISYRDLEKRGILLPLTDASATFKQPARYDDLVEIRTTIREVTPLRLHFGYEVIRVE
ncbi:acyl-CoA thioesterase, partial [Microbacteriaceae bacterium K1510]|nr:acyl-CoA thioesterase [Microbacteriaceae bacterium K1510]